MRERRGRAWGWSDAKLRQLAREYNFQKEETRLLDKLSGPFTPGVIRRVALWKLNRCVILPPDVLAQVNVVIRLKPGQHRKAREVLLNLLDPKRKDMRGVRLPMASTILRFRNPDVFQIIDRHAYRALCGEDIGGGHRASPDREAAQYFDYLDRLWEYQKARPAVDFQLLDRVLYQGDKELSRRKHPAPPARLTIVRASP